MSIQLRFELGRQLEIVRVGYKFRKVHRRAELLRIAEPDKDKLATPDGGGGRIAGAEVDADVHGDARRERVIFDDLIFGHCLPSTRHTTVSAYDSSPPCD